MEKKTRVYEITAPEDQLDELEQMFEAIQYMSSIGASREIKLYVDGDGAAYVKINKINAVGKAEKLPKGERDEDNDPKLNYELGC